jgi:hypothetical protein
VVPCPARGGGFIDADDHWLPHYANRSVQRLHGVRVQALGARGERGLLSGWLQAIDVQERWLFFRREFRGEMSVANLRRTIQRLLAASRAVDATVRLSAQVGAWSSAELRVGRFDLQLREMGNTLTVEGLDGRCGEMDPDASVVVLTRPLYDFQVDEEPLLRQGSTEAAWEFETTRRGSGPWLVYGHVDGQYRIRPTVINVTDNQALEPAEDGGLSSLTCIADARLRDERMRARLHDLASLPGDADWTQLNRGLEVLQGRLPLVCVDLFKLLPKVPEALIMMLARAFGERVDAILRLEDELPFGWVVLSMETWQSAFARVLEWRQRTVIEHGALEEDARETAVSLVSGTLESMVASEAVLQGHIAILREDLGIPDPLGEPPPSQLARPAVVKTIVQLRLEAQQQACLQRNDGVEWPSRFSFRDHVTRLPAEHLNLPGWKHAVLDAPYAAAWIAANGGQIGGTFAQAIRQCREFDPVYFDETYPLILVCAVHGALPFEPAP